MNRSDLDRICARIRCECSARGAGEQGIALISVILLIMVLSFVSAAAIVTSTTELKIGGNFKTSVQSFYNAEAGVQYALGQIRNQYRAGKLNITASSAVVNYASPDNSYLLPDGNVPFSNWNTTQLTLKTGTTLDSDYQFQTTGYYANSRTTLEAVLRMPSFHLVKGMFASGALNVKNGLECKGPPPDLGSKTEFGSNTSLHAGNQEFPKVVLGGNATYGDKTAKHQNTLIEQVRTMDVDPLGAAALVDAASKYSTISNSSNLLPGNYYFTDLDGALTISGTGDVNIYVADNLSLGNITINVGSGPLTIFYDGAETVEFKGISFNSGGTASNLKIISASPANFDFTDLKNDAYFTGLIYAPYAKIEFKNKADVKGLLWGRTIEAMNKLTFEYDATAETFFATEPLPMLMTWKQL